VVDGLCCKWEIGRRDLFNGGEGSTMQDVIFETMGKTISIDSNECRFAALDGLSHLPSSTVVVSVESPPNRKEFAVANSDQVKSALRLSFVC
jgi:hypothetical protein